LEFALTKEHEAFRRVVREFAEAELAPHSEEWDRTEEFPADAVRAMGDLGLFGLPFPEEYGGADADFITFLIALEEIARVDSSLAATLEAGVGLGAYPIYEFGTEEQKQRWLPDLTAGRAVAAFGLTEPDGGTDAGNTATRAERDGDEWVINGSKAFITNSGTEMTSLITITARTEGDAITTIVVPSGSPGLTVEPSYRKLGWRASDTHGLTFDDCRVPADHLLGEEGKGFHQFLATLDAGRIAIGAMAVGLAEACLEQSLAYARARESFGKPIGSNQAIAFRLSDLATAIDAARLLTYRAAWLKDTGADFTEAAAKAKLFASEMAMDAARTATQVFGGSGFMEETPAARFYRDAKILEIGEGTSEVQRHVIARSLGLPI
jgi:short/branched chain acyl-CoA dehydrogenase